MNKELDKSLIKNQYHLFGAIVAATMIKEQYDYLHTDNGRYLYKTPYQSLSRIKVDSYSNYSQVTEDSKDKFCFIVGKESGSAYVEADFFYDKPTGYLDLKSFHVYDDHGKSIVFNDIKAMKKQYAEDQIKEATSLGMDIKTYKAFESSIIDKEYALGSTDSISVSEESELQL